MPLFATKTPARPHRSSLNAPSPERALVIRPAALAAAPSVLLAFACIAFALGCGRTASVEDCEQIVVRMTELELKANHVTDPKLVDEQVASTKGSFRERALKECVGRQLSENAMTCIRSATSSDQILSECLN